jgi:hypothetical protein
MDTRADDEIFADTLLDEDTVCPYGCQCFPTKSHQELPDYESPNDDNSAVAIDSTGATKSSTIPQDEYNNYDDDLSILFNENSQEPMPAPSPLPISAPSPLPISAPSPKPSRKTVKPKQAVTFDDEPMKPKSKPKPKSAKARKSKMVDERPMRPMKPMRRTFHCLPPDTVLESHGLQCSHNGD